MRDRKRQAVRRALIKALGHGVDAVRVTEETDVSQQEDRHLWILKI